MADTHSILADLRHLVSLRLIPSSFADPQMYFLARSVGLKVDDGLSNLESNLLKAIAASKPPVAPPGSLALQVTRLVQVLLSQSRMLLLL